MADVFNLVKAGKGEVINCGAHSPCWNWLKQSSEGKPLKTLSLSTYENNPQKANRGKIVEKLSLSLSTDKNNPQKAAHGKKDLLVFII